MHGRRDIHTYKSSFLCLYELLATLSLFSATCARVTPTASYHPTGLEDNLLGIATKEERKITNIKEWGVKISVSLVMPDHQPKP